MNTVLDSLGPKLSTPMQKTFLTNFLMNFLAATHVKTKIPTCKDDYNHYIAVVYISYLIFY